MALGPATEDTTKHLELIQAIITRMGANSFAVKTWAVSLVAAVFAVAAAKDGAQLVAVALLPALVFWFLDAYYLRQERLFRALYDAIRLGKHPEEMGPFSMNTRPYASCDENRYRAVFWSRTILGLYGPLVLLVLLATAGVGARAVSGDSQPAAMPISAPSASPTIR